MLLYLLGDVDRINMSFLIMFSLFFFLQECSNEILHIWNLFGLSRLFIQDCTGQYLSVLYRACITAHPPVLAPLVFLERGGG